MNQPSEPIWLWPSPIIPAIIKQNNSLMVRLLHVNGNMMEWEWAGNGNAVECE